MNDPSSELIKGIFETVIENVGYQKLKKFEKTDLLLTGANGFIGKNLILFFTYLNTHYFKKHATLHCIIRSKKSFAGFPEPDNNFIRFIYQDITKSFNFKSHIDYVFHLASITSPREISKNPIQSIDININGLINTLNSISRAKIRKFVYFSSSAIYGTPEKRFIPIPESYAGNISPLSVRASYAESKRLGETLIFLYNNQFKLPSVILRPFHIFGPFMDLKKDNALNYFIRCVIDNKPIILLGNSKVTRSFCYISDTLTIILLAALSENIFSVYNLGNENNEITINNLARLVSSLSGKCVPIRKKTGSNPFADEPLDRNVPDMNKVLIELQYKPKTSLEDGLKETVKWALYAKR